MSTQPDVTVRDPGSLRLQLRGDLHFTPQWSGGTAYYMVEDPVGSRFFRLGIEEYALVSLLDGDTSLDDALSLLSSKMPHHRLAAQDAAAICKWLVDANLAHTEQSRGAERMAAAVTSQQQRARLERINPLMFRIPLCRPDELFRRLAAPLSGLFSPVAVALWCVLVVVGAYHVFAGWERFAVSSQGVFAPTNWIWLAGCWVVLKLVHETAHGVACRRFGGPVRELGVLMVLFAPLAYVDVTTSWRFRSRRQRIVVAAAGMAVELAIAAAAAVAWSHTQSGWLNHVCYNVIVMAGISTLLFNANPLMKFDGYYILSDLLAIPNLSVNGQQQLRYWARKYLLGVPATLPAWPGPQVAIIRIYGVAAFCWRVFVCVGLTIAASALFHGAGVVLAGTAAVLWLGLPTVRLCKYLWFGKQGERPHRVRFACTAGMVGGALVAVMMWVPWPGAHRAPAVVEYAPFTVVRAGGAGFVREILVDNGDEVHEGQLLVVLDNPELRRELADLQLAAQQCDVRCRKLRRRNELAAYQAEAEKRQSLLTQLSEKEEQVRRLAVHAGRPGHIVRHDLPTLLGTYLDVGDEVLSIGEERHKELRLSISEDDFERFRHAGKSVLRVDLPGEPLFSTTVSKIIPRADRSPSHPALAAINGGPLPVRKPERSDAANGTDDDYELLAPRFTGLAPLSRSQSARLLAGQVGAVSYRACDQSIGQHLYQSLADWIRRRAGRLGQSST